jgi:hypothetical protein
MLSAGNGDNFRNESIEKSVNMNFLIIFQPVLLAKSDKIA